MFSRSAPEAPAVEPSSPPERAEKPPAWQSKCLQPSTFAQRAKEQATARPRRLVSLGTQEILMEGTGPKRRDGSREGGRMEEVELLYDADHPTHFYRRFRWNPHVLEAMVTPKNEGDWSEPIGIVGHRWTGHTHYNPAPSDEVQVLGSPDW